MVSGLYTLEDGLISNMADKMTYYEILGVNRDSSLKEIAKAFRKKSLKCHPDKNPDNLEAVELFHELCKALEVLSDPKAKAAYDVVLKAKERARLRTQALDAKRKKFKQDLEQREDAAKNEKDNEEMAAKNLQAEIERLREEGSKLLKEQQEILKAQLGKEMESGQDETKSEEATPKLKVRWKSKKSDIANGGYTQEMLQSLFEKYGEVSYVIVSSKKKGSAVVELKSVASAKLALENECGIPGNPLKISWLDGFSSVTDANSQTVSEHSDSMRPGSGAAVDSKPPEPSFSSDSTISDKDYESVVLMKLRQFEERKRLIKEMQEDDQK